MISTIPVSQVGSDYAKELENLRVELLKIKQAMEAHPEGTERRRRHYEQYCALEDQRDQLADVVPQLVALDGEIAAASDQLGRAHDAVSAGTRWSQLTAVTSILGLGLVLLSPVWMPTVLMPVIGCVLLVIAAVALVASNREHRYRQGMVDDWTGRLWALNQNRKELLSGQQTG